MLQNTVRKMLPNPLKDFLNKIIGKVLLKSFPELEPIMALVGLLIIAGILYVIWKYYTKNKLLLAAILLLLLYFLFA